MIKQSKKFNYCIHILQININENGIGMYVKLHSEIKGIDLAASNKLSLDWDCARTDCKHCGYVQENPNTLLTHYYAVVILVVEFSAKSQNIDFY